VANPEKRGGIAAHYCCASGSYTRGAGLRYGFVDCLDYPDRKTQEKMPIQMHPNEVESHDCGEIIVWRKRLAACESYPSEDLAASHWVLTSLSGVCERLFGGSQEPSQSELERIKNGAVNLTLVHTPPSELAQLAKLKQRQIVQDIVLKEAAAVVVKPMKARWEELGLLGVWWPKRKAMW
jgi:hypothetical protein